MKKYIIELTLTTIVSVFMTIGAYELFPAYALYIIIFHFTFGVLSILLLNHYRLSLKKCSRDDMTFISQAIWFAKLLPLSLLMSGRYIPLGLVGFIAVISIHAEKIQTITLPEE